MSDSSDPPTSKSVVARIGGNWLVPYLAVALFAVTMLVLVGVIERRDVVERRGMVERDMQWADQTLRLHLQANQEFLVQLGRNLASSGLDYEDFQIRAAQYLANNPELSVVLWADRDGNRLWFVVAQGLAFDQFHDDVGRFILFACVVD